MTRAGTLVLALAALGALPACIKQAPTRYYLLEAPATAAPAAAATAAAGITIGIRSLAVDTPYDESAIVYRVGRDSPEVGFYAYHEWASPLSRMLPRLIADALAGTAGVAVIEPAAPGTAYDAILDGRLIALEEVDLEGGQEVRLRMSLRLGAGDETLWSGSVDAQASTHTEEVAAIVRLMNRVVLDAVGGLEPELEAVLLSRFP